MSKDILFNSNEELRRLFAEIRSLKFHEKYPGILFPPQPGLFLGSKYLFIAQNPSVPKPNIISSDATLLMANIDDITFHEAYKKSQMSWKYYDFIKDIIGNSMDFSITNIVFFPTLDNSFPHQFAIEDCRKYLKKIIKLVEPQNIICVGALATIEIKSLGLEDKYNVIYSEHYSSLLRKGNDYYNKRVNYIKENLK